jgi:transposase-like protein
MTMPSMVEDETTQVSRRSTYRRHSADYKARIVAEWEAGTPEQRGSLLRREGLRRTQVYEWRKTAGMGDQPKKRRAKRTPEQIENDKLRARNKKLEDELARTKLALEITGKAHALLEMLSESAASETESPK